MQTQTEIENTIRAGLPLLFGSTDSSSDSEFRTKFDALVDYATKVSEPILKPDTIRYQSMIVYWTLIFLTLQFLEIGRYKVGDAMITVDGRFVALYTTFLFAVGIIFLVKAYIDYQRSDFVRTKNATAISDLQTLMTIGWAKRMIQEHFWDETFDRIGRTYGAYACARASLLGRPSTFQHIDMRSQRLDLAKLSSNPELSSEIRLREARLSELDWALRKDEERLQARIDLIPPRRADDDIDDPTALRQSELWAKLDEAFEGTVGRWLNARNNLVSEHLKNRIAEMGETPEVRRMTAMKTVLERTTRIRKAYVMLEVLAPVAFALAAVALVWATRT